MDLPIFLVLYAGLTHAFEVDHVLAVSNIVSQGNNIRKAAKNGIFWGIGHTSTILVIGVLMMIFKMNIAPKTFSYFEATVGAMLVVIAIYRLAKFFRENKIAIHRHTHEHSGSNAHTHIHLPLVEDENKDLHKTSFGIGLVHGLAGSGALVVLAMTQFKTASMGILYLVLFGIGAIAGMFLAAAVFSIPFSKRIINLYYLRVVLILASSVLCLCYGFYSIYSNLFQV